MADPMAGQAPLPADLAEAITMVKALDAQIQDIGVMFGQRCQEIPVQVSSPEALIEWLKPPNGYELLGIIERVRSDAEISYAEFTALMEFCLPRYYHPGPVAYLVHDHQLGQYLSQRFPKRRRAIRDVFTPSRYEIAAIIAHEKYGHGFIYRETTLGQQLNYILQDQELFRAIVSADRQPLLRHPWKRQVLQDHSKWLPYLFGSMVIVDEGFSGWVQSKILLRLGGLFTSYAARKLTRHPYAVPFEGLIPWKAYFSERGYDLIDKRIVSPHKIGYDWIDHIYEILGYRCISCVLHVVQMALDVDFGIYRTQGNTIHIETSPDLMCKFLIEGKPEYYLADLRLKALENILAEREEELLAQQEEWRCHEMDAERGGREMPCWPFIEGLMEYMTEWLEDDNIASEPSNASSAST